MMEPLSPLWIATAPGSSHERLESPRDVDVAVLGAGIAGLTTALFLRERGAEVMLLEADRNRSRRHGASEFVSKPRCAASRFRLSPLTSAATDAVDGADDREGELACFGVFGILRRHLTEWRRR
jgi:glycine/D-amino acid oxidase-like deaminating enzyme